MSLTDSISTTRVATEESWLRCPGCDGLVYRRHYQRNLKVCPHCRHHGRLTADERLSMVLDSGSIRRFATEIISVDLLGFVDTKPYAQRLAENRARTGSPAAVQCVTGAIGGHDVVVALLDFAFLGGSVGGGAGELVATAARLAGSRRVPLLIISSSGGARMQEGIISLMQLAKTSQELARLHAAGVLVVNLNVDPTYGGATASFSMLGDVVLAEPGARIGFAGPQVIKQTIRQELPDGFQTAEFLLANGQVDLVVDREELRPLLCRIFAAHAAHGAESPDGDAELITDPDQLPVRLALDVVTAARSLDRPTTLAYCANVFDDFIELHGDRLGGGDDPALVGGLATLAGRPVVVIGQQKGPDVAELTYRNFGMPQPWGYHKAYRLMEYAARFGFPLITFIDTPGAYPGIDAERRGQAYAIARCLATMSDLPVPIITVVTGEGGSGGALAIGVGDRGFILENAYLSVISPEGCSTILFGTATSASVAAEQLRLTPRDLLALGAVHGVVPEPAGGAQQAPVEMAARLRRVLANTLAELDSMPIPELLAQRYRRFAGYGAGEQPVVNYAG